MLRDAANLPHRSSSPLKRRASGMDPDNERRASEESDMNMAAPQHAQANHDSSNGLPRAMSLDPPDQDGLSTTHASSDAKPPIAEQVKVIEAFLKAFSETRMKEGDKAFLVSRTWVNKALALRSDPNRANVAPAEESLGAIDNSDIIDRVMVMSDGQRFTRLKPGADLEDFELFPDLAWDMVVSWYGIKDGQEAICRFAVNTSTSPVEPNIIYEFHPPIFRVHRLWSQVSPLPIEQSVKASDPGPLKLVRSRMYHTQTFFKELKTLAGIPIERQFRLWIISQERAPEDTKQPISALTTPPTSPGCSSGADKADDPWTHLLVDVVAFAETVDRRRKVPAVDQTYNPKYNGSATLQLHELGTDQTLVIDEAIDEFYVSNFNGRSRPSASIGAYKQSATASSRSNSGRSSPAPQGPLTRGRAQKKPRSRNLGAVGLHNLGNTCYMSSALQCVRSVEELTKYFLTETYASEINKTNPLGYYGKVAMAYGNLLKEIYDEGRSAVSPREFKATVGRCRSTFSGFGQQDSQEFLGFLLDGLQEDLSRVKKKPYIEKPDSTDEMINNPDAIREMAGKVWDITRRRDDSVIADLFTGMYKSTLKCPHCGKISITFDPFNNLTLPLPVEDVVCRTVKFFPLNDVPVKFEVEMKKHSAIETLKQFISDRTGVPVNRLMGAEEFKGSFFKIYDNNQDASEEISSSDIPTIHELEAVPTNWPGRATKKYRPVLDINASPEAEWDDDRNERMVVPVFHRRPDASFRGHDLVPPPHFIMLSKDETRDMDSIRRKVLGKVATFSTWSKFSEVKGHESEEATDVDMTVTTASDGDSSGDTKFVARSIEGEDDMVDVVMKGGTGASAATVVPVKVLRQFDTRRPPFLEPESFLDPELQNLFELSYFEARDEVVPTGWQSIDNNRELPKLSDRIVEATAEDEDEDENGEASPDGSSNTASGNEDSSNENISRAEQSFTRMVDESSEEEEGVDRQFHPRGTKNFGPRGRRKFKGHKSYGKKGNKRWNKELRSQKQQYSVEVPKSQLTPPATPDGGPLIRLGEGLVVNWSEESWDRVFGGVPGGAESSTQGKRTFVDLEKVPDGALKSNQRRRATRRSRGITLDECLDEFERAEILSEQDMWYCPRCKEHRRASKKFDLWKTPDVLVVHLKRFSSSGWRRDKLDVLVDFPIQNLDLTSRVIQKEDGKAEVYDLIAIDDHYGGLGGGHYTAYARNFVDGRWYHYNDSSVSVVSDPASAITSAAYLLFYRRRSSQPLGGPRFKEIFEKYDKRGEDEDEASGDDVAAQGGVSCATGSQRRRPQLQNRSTKTTIRSLGGPDDDVESRDYEESIRDSIEDEFADMPGSYESNRPKSLDLTQGWNFTGLQDASRDGDEDGVDGASEDAQPGSCGSERAGSPDLGDEDTDMTSTRAGGHEHSGDEAAPKYESD